MPLTKKTNSGWFKKGSVPANKGRKMVEYCSPEVIERIKNTQYKKNHLPHNAKYDGYISLRKDKITGITYQYVRISERRFDLLQRFIWQESNGIIPVGSIIIFKDGNTMNCKIENLEMITKEENMKRNIIHRYPEELQKLIKQNNKLKKTIKDAK